MIIDDDTVILENDNPCNDLYIYVYGLGYIAEIKGKYIKLDEWGTLSNFSYYYLQQLQLVKDVYNHKVQLYSLS